MSARRGTWRAIGESVIGLAHERDGRPCQDDCRVHSSTPGAVVAAVADGHGQTRSFRSQDGARIAVEVAVDVLVRFAQSEVGESDCAFRARMDLAGHLPRVVAQTWRERVRQHFERHRFSPDEVKLLDDRFPIDSYSRMSPDAYRALWRAYGTTLLAVLVTGPYAVALQIGDGLLMAAGACGSGFEVLDPDALNFGTSTTSLSDEDAELRLRWRLIPHEGDFPILYWLCTDGYEKAFRSDDLAGICIEYRDTFRERDGWKVIRGNLAEGLRQASARGTGDDATAAFLFFEEDEIGAVEDAAGEVAESDGEACSNGVDGSGGVDGESEHGSGGRASDSASDANGGESVPPSCDGGPMAGYVRHAVSFAGTPEPCHDSESQGGGP